MEESSTEVVPARSRVPEWFLFASNFLRDPYMLGSIIPSSRFLVNAVLDGIDWTRARVIVEYGPGVGTFTAEILRRMRPDAQSNISIASRDALETRGEFLVYQFTSRVLPVLRETFPDVRRGFEIRNFPPAQIFACAPPRSPRQPKR